MAAIEVNGDSRIIPPKLFFDANSVATPVPSDSPYKTIFLLSTPFSFIHLIILFAS